MKIKKGKLSFGIKKIFLKPNKDKTTLKAEKYLSLCSIIIFEEKILHYNVYHYKLAFFT